MKQPLLFLSHAGEDAAAARELARHLERSDVPVWLDVERLRPGDRWMESLERALEEATAFAVYVGRSGVARWVGQEVRVALDRSVAEEGFAVIPVLGPGSDPAELPVFLRQRQWVDLRGGLDDPAGLRELAEVVVGEDRRGERVRRSLLPPDRAPFLGLRTFGEDDAFLFFGRDREVEELLDRLGAAPFLAVVGASGSGKSSLVRAGLLPALRRGRAPGGRQGAGSGAASGSPVASWRIALFRPADDPFRELAAALPGLDPDLGAADRIEVGARIARELADPGAGAAQGIERAVAALVPAGTRTLLVADQLEEAFTQTGDPELRRRFLDALLAAGRLGGDRPVHVVATLRADFYSRCWEHPELPSRIAANQFAVERMASDQLREVIEKPLALAGVEPEPGLVDELLDDAGDEPGNLPLLEHALFQLWDQPAGRRFTHEAYRAMGGLAGALEHHAEAVYEGLDAEQRDLLRRLLPRLAVVGDPGAVTRRRVPKEDLLAASGPVEEGRARAAALLDLWVERRLLTAMGAGAEAGEERVEAAHEALLRSWDRLRGWLEEDREFLLWRQGLAEAVNAWECGERSEGDLLRGNPLRRATDWLERRRQDLTPSEADLIAASLAYETAERERELAQARARAAAERRARLRLAWAALALVAGIVVTGWLMLDARRKESLAVARELAARAETASETRPQLGALLALHSLRIASGAGESELPEGESALRLALSRLGGRVVGEPAETVLAGAVTPEAVLLATRDRGEAGDRLLLRRVALPLPEDLEIPRGDARILMAERPSKALLSPSGRWLAATAESGPPRLWRLEAGGGEPREVRLTAEGGLGTLPAAVEIDLGRQEGSEYLVAEGSDETLRTWLLPAEPPAAPLAPTEVAPAPPGDREDVSAFGFTRSCLGLDLMWYNGVFQAVFDSPLRERGELALRGLDEPPEGCDSEGEEAPGRFILAWNAAEPARLWEPWDSPFGSGPLSKRIGRLAAPLIPHVRAYLVGSSNGRWVADLEDGLGLQVHEVVRTGEDLRVEISHRALSCGGRPGSEIAVFSPGDDLLLARNGGNDVCLWNLADGRARERPRVSWPPIQEGSMGDLAVSSGGRLIAETMLGEVYLRRDPRECPGAPSTEALNPHLAAYVVVAFGGDEWLAAGDTDGLLQLYRVPAGGGCEPPADVLTYQSSGASGIAVLTFGEGRLAVGRGDGDIELWSLEEIGEEGAAPRRLLGHNALVDHLAFNRDGTLLASADHEGVIMLWDLARPGDLRRVRLGASRPLLSLAFRSDAEELITVAEREFPDLSGPIDPSEHTSSVESWTLDLSRLQYLACQAAGRDLSPGEAREHLGDAEQPEACPGLARAVD